MTHPNHHGFPDLELGSKIEVWWDQWINLWVVTRHDEEGNQVGEASHHSQKKWAMQEAQDTFALEPRWHRIEKQTRDGVKTLIAERGINIVRG